MARDLSRLRRSRSAASRPKKAHSPRQEVEVDLDEENEQKKHI